MMFYSLQSEKHEFQSQTNMSFVVFSLVLNSKPEVLHTLDLLSKTELIPQAPDTGFSYDSVTLPTYNHV